LVGAGGKTTTLFELGQALVASGQAQTALLTTTTHLGAWQVQDADHHMALENSAQVDHWAQTCLLVCWSAQERLKRGTMPTGCLAWHRRFWMPCGNWRMGAAFPCWWRQMVRACALSKRLPHTNRSSRPG